MGTVHDFPSKTRAFKRVKFSAEQVRAAVPKATALPKAGGLGLVFRWAFGMVRMALFLILFWLRMPVRFLCNIVGGAMMLAWLFSLYAFPEKSHMVWGFGMTSFVCFVIAWLYDFLLMALSPQDMMMTL